MYRKFPPITIDDLSGDEAEVIVTTDAAGRHCVRFAARANCHPHTSAHLEPEAARAIASALLEAADEAECRQGEDDALDAYCATLTPEARGGCEPTCTMPPRHIGSCMPASVMRRLEASILAGTRNMPGQAEDERLGQS